MVIARAKRSQPKALRARGAWEARVALMVENPVAI
jgi:hypothetical protein